MFAARMRGPTYFPAFIPSRILPSYSMMPPTVRMVVTPLMSWVLAFAAQIISTTRRMSAVLVTVFTSLVLSACFFFGRPEAGRCRCRFISPGIIYLPPRSTFSQSAPSLPAGTMPTIFSPSVMMLMPFCGCIFSLPSSIMPFIYALFMAMLLLLYLCSDYSRAARIFQGFIKSSEHCDESRPPDIRSFCL